MFRISPGSELLVNLKVASGTDTNASLLCPVSRQDLNCL